MKKYIEDEFEVTEYDSGTIVKQAIAAPLEEYPKEIKPSFIERLTNIENTLDMILLKQEGII